MFMNLQDEYQKRVSIIKARLNKFSKISKDDYFYEACFCILTPQSSAKQAWKSILSLKEEDFKNKNIDPVKFLSDKIRFHHNKSKYLLELKEKWNNINEKLNSIKDSNKLREFLVENVKGYGYKEASLPYDEKIITLVDGDVKFINIGGFYENYRNGIYKNKTIESFAFNPNTLKYEIAPITNVLKHLYKKDL